MLTFTKNKMNTHAQTLPGGADRAKCYNIANLCVGSGRTIAQAMSDDHNSSSGALRASQLMVDAGCAKHIQTKKEKDKCFYGTFVFEDGSELK